MSDAASQSESILTGEANPPATPVKTGPEGVPQQQFTSSTQVSSLEDLKTKAPEVYQAMLEGIAQNIVRKMQDHARRLKKLMQEGRQR